VIFRTIAILIAIAGAIDPAFRIQRPRPVAVELVTGRGELARQTRDRLIAEVGDAISLARAGEGDAIVLIDARPDVESIREGISISAVTSGEAPNLRLVGARGPSLLLPGAAAAIEVEAEVAGLEGRKSVVRATRNGVEVGRTDHTWSSARHQRLFVPFVTTTAGASALRLSVEPFADETERDDNAVEARSIIVDRLLRVAFVEPRPSWAAGFVRRVLEADPLFEVASVVQPSRGIAVRTGDIPSSLAVLGGQAATTLRRFDVLVVGAPEELHRPDLESLRTFMADRGGTVVFLPDRRPTGPYAPFVSASGFDEVLLDAPVALESSGAARPPRTSELAVPRGPSPTLRALASLNDGRPAIAAWPIGDGALLFSGALDAWRFRADNEDRFASFWRATIASAALAAPPGVQVDVQPPVVAAGAEARVIARVRRTDFERGPGGELRVPEVASSLSRIDGRTTATEAVRLWPTAEPGVFEGRLTSSRSGVDSVHVTAGSAAASTVIVRGDSEGPARGDAEESRMIAAASGGAVGTVGDLTPIVRHLRSVGGKEIADAVHPMRSAWWSLPFALALCGEWALRRRRGER
jgi:hypothetical protein